ncbi:MAG: hypothetical protein JWL63_2987 [Rhodocyclales bacterium]|nr:hypothetical protein [Rhodocyclales bacterium]
MKSFSPVWSLGSIVTRATAAIARIKSASGTMSAKLPGSIVLLATMWHAGLANAVVLSGSFTGVAANSTWGTIADGTPVNGTFRFDSSFPFTLIETDGVSHAHYETFNGGVPPDPIHFSFFVPSVGLSFDVNSFGVLGVDLEDTAAGQTIRFSSYFIHGAGAAFTLAGLDGAFFDGLDLSSLHSGAADLSGSLAHLAAHGGIESDVYLASLVFDPADVPEPPAPLLLGTGFIILLAGKRARKRKY